MRARALQRAASVFVTLITSGCAAVRALRLTQGAQASALLAALKPSVTLPTEVLFAQGDVTIECFFVVAGAIALCRVPEVCVRGPPLVTHNVNVTGVPTLGPMGLCWVELR